MNAKKFQTTSATTTTNKQTSKQSKQRFKTICSAAQFMPPLHSSQTFEQYFDNKTLTARRRMAQMLYKCSLIRKIVKCFMRVFLISRGMRQSPNRLIPQLFGFTLFHVLSLGCTNFTDRPYRSVNNKVGY